MSYLQFEPTGKSPSGKTDVVAVRSRDAATLGVLSWYGPWRRYTFAPFGSPVFDAACLREIADHAEAMTKAHGALRSPAPPREAP